MEVPSTRNVGDACERAQVSWRATVKNSVTQHGDLVLYALRYPQPVKVNERISDVIGALQVEDQPTGLGARGRLGCRPARCCRSPAGSAPERRPASGTWSLACTDGSGGVDAAQRNSTIPFAEPEHVSASTDQRRCKCPNHGQTALG